MGHRSAAHAPRTTAASQHTPRTRRAHDGSESAAAKTISRTTSDAALSVSANTRNTTRCWGTNRGSSEVMWRSPLPGARVLPVEELRFEADTLEIVGAFLEVALRVLDRLVID